MSQQFSKANDHYYFFMKVGNSNCFLKYCQQLGGLWVGYDLDPIPKITADGMVVRGEEEADLRYLAYASQEQVRDRIRVVSYGKDHLHIFEVTGPLKYLGRNSAVDWADPENYKTFPAAWWEEVERDFQGVGSEKFLATMLGDLGWKLLPAKLVVPRPTISLDT